MFDASHIIQVGGLLAVGVIIFAESGMMIGFFLPGDTLLFSAGILAATGAVSLPAVILVIAIAAVAGDNVGYQIGRQFGRRLFRNPGGVIFRQEHLKRAESFYEKYGSKTMLVAHFVPVVRTFAPVTAGAGRMPLQKFVLFDAIGDIAWAVIVPLIGYFLGSRIPGIEKLIEPILILVVIVSLAPTLYNLIRDPKMRQLLMSFLHRS